MLPAFYRHLLLLLVLVSLAKLAYGEDCVYSSEPLAWTVSSSMVTRKARSETECALLCAGASGAESCQACAFSAATGSCHMAQLPNANFLATAPGVAVYRRPYNSSWFTGVYAKVGNRTFRVIQQRSKGNLSFARNWTDYESGFGDNADFWLGLHAISNLTASTPRILRVELVTWAGVLYVSEYSGFTVGNATSMYTMTYTSYLTDSSNTTQDSLNYHKGAKFSALGMDNSACTCPTSMCGGGGWWYKCCSYTNPSGLYYQSAVSNGERTMNWYGAGGNRLALKSTRLMLLL